MLVRLLYASRAVDTSPEAIESILSQARQQGRLAHSDALVVSAKCIGEEKRRGHRPRSNCAR